jgi:hypothetical protein
MDKMKKRMLVEIEVEEPVTVPLEILLFEDECFGLVYATGEGIVHWRNRHKTIWLPWKVVSTEWIE